MGVDNLFDLIDRELELYRRLVTEQKQKIQLYLEGDLDRVRTSIERDKDILEEIRRLNQLLDSELDGRLLSEIASENGNAMKIKIEELRRVTSELSRLDLQNFRYIRSSFGFTRSVLGEIFANNINYNQNGYLQTGETVVEF
jgi:hypothetical protein